MSRVSDYLGSSVLGGLHRRSAAGSGHSNRREETKLEREEEIPPPPVEKAKARVERSMIQRKARIQTGGIEGVRLGKGKFLRKKRGRKSNGGANICQGEDSPGAESRI